MRGIIDYSGEKSFVILCNHSGPTALTVKFLRVLVILSFFATRAGQRSSLLNV